MKNVPGNGDAIEGRDALTAAEITPGVLKPLDVLVEKGGAPAAVAARLGAVDGITAAAAPKDWRNGDAALVEAFPAVDGADPGIQPIIDRSKAALRGTGATVGGKSGTSGLTHLVPLHSTSFLRWLQALPEGSAEARL